MAAAGIGLFVRLERQSLMPTFQESDLLVEVESAPGTSHPAMNRIASQATRELRAIPGVRTVSAQVGRAVLSDRVGDINKGQIWIGLDRDAEYGATIERIHQVVEGYAGIDVDASTYLKACVTDPVDGVSGDSDDEDIVVRIYGDDWKVLKAKAGEVQKALGEVSGIVNSEIDLPAEEPQVEIKVNMEAAKQHGLKPGDVRRAASTLLSGIEVGYLFEQQKVFDVVVWGAPETRESLTNIQNLLIDTPGGKLVPLKEVADVRVSPSPTIIKREAVSRHIDVIAGVEGRDVASVAALVESRLLDIDFPLEYRAELLRGSAERLAARHRAIGAVIAAAVGIFLVLQSCIGSWSLAIVLFVTLPAAVAGGALAALAMGGTLSLGALLGLVAVLAIAIRNGISLIQHYQFLSQPLRNDGNAHQPRPHFEQRLQFEPAARNDDAIVAPEVVRRGTWDRFAPILATAVITAAAFLPFAVMGDVPGTEILHPMSIVVLGGLVSATLFTLLAIPAMFLLFTPSRVNELEDLARHLVGEDELRESIATPRAADDEMHLTKLNS
jgi:Cu/Ag efflux pump CusA